MRAKAFPGEDPKTLPAPGDIAPFVVRLALPETKTNGETLSYRNAQDRKLVLLADRRGE
jgi:hypothetical protein